MAVLNSDIAGIFDNVADLLEIESANEFRVRAYRNAARTVSSLSVGISEMVKAGEDLTRLPGIGKDLAGKIIEIVNTGSLALLKELEEQTPPGLLLLMRIPALGPKRIKALHRELGITNIEELKRNAEEGRISSLKGFGQKTEEAILKQVEGVMGIGTRILLSKAQEAATDLLSQLEGVRGIRDLIVAGSYRRRKETVGDLDVLVTCTKDSKVMETFVAYDAVTNILAKGETRSSVILRSGLQVDLRKVPVESYGAALHYFTGSKAHNIAVRKLALRKKLKINEYGVFKGEKRIAGVSEQEVFAQVNLPYIEPELREDSGEIERGLEGKLPRLITLSRIRGDLHTHSVETDGHNTLEEMAAAAGQRGYEYLAVTDHSRRVAMVHGLDPERLVRQMEQIDRINSKLEGIRLLKSIEVDILEDGSLDLPDEILKELDVVVCSVHYGRSLSKRKQTQRILKAMEKPFFHVLAHPTGRLLSGRAPYEVDLDEVIRKAGQEKRFLEINAHPDRLDLSDRYCRRAKELGVKLAISTDAHRTTDLDFMPFGLDQARRGWLEADDVINTRGLNQLFELLRR
jgi:DNA polymerase (family 10)